MAFPIPDAWGEIPSPRLVADVPVAVSGLELAPLSISPATKEPLTVVEGEKLTIPLNHTRCSEFSGATLNLRTMGAVFERAPAFDVSLTADSSQAVLDMAALKPPPGDYLIAFYGGVVTKYRQHPDAVPRLEESRRQAEQELQRIDAELKNIIESSQSAAPESKSEAEKSLDLATTKQKAVAATLAAATERLKAAIEAAKPRDIVDILVSEPISIRVLPSEKK